MTPTTQNHRRKKFDVVRAAALEALIVIEQGQQTDSAVSSVMQGKNFRPIDKRFLLQLVNGTTKMRRRLDHEIKFYLSRPGTELPPKLANILRLGFYQLRFTDRIPAAAAVSESVNLAHYMTGRSRANLVNAVMRASLREPQKVKFSRKSEDPVKYLGDYYSYPDYFVEYCLKEFGYEQTEQLLRLNNHPPHVTYRVNSLKVKPDEVSNILQKNEVEFSYGRYLPEFIHIEESGLPLDSELIKTGKVFVQDESAGLAVRLLDPQPGEEAIDLAAAPGGKSTYIAALMGNTGQLVSVDKSRHRLAVLSENAKRLGIKNIEPVVSDLFNLGNDRLFDRVLLDPPCSGWGTAGKHSDLRWAKTPDDINKLARIQTAMLNRAAKLIKPGGVLVYSTCSIIRAENDDIVHEFVSRNEDFEAESAGTYFPEDVVDKNGYIKTYPSFEKLDGAFAARIRRKE
ncbi:MAG: 16S rRNA (cytosine(967)-C(5))-methyltransferase RsmB [Candidatus Zixiibacteriota bacterium]|nr:MAG: 16S rRNA (cytosine(967)-C(5))-methyltransferase RsmB [candidate division Zixibacteria bacterium]